MIDRLRTLPSEVRMRGLFWALNLALLLALLAFAGRGALDETPAPPAQYRGR